MCQCRPFSKKSCRFNLNIFDGPLLFNYVQSKTFSLKEKTLSFWKLVLYQTPTNCYGNWKCLGKQGLCILKLFQYDMSFTMPPMYIYINITFHPDHYHYRFSTLPSIFMEQLQQNLQIICAFEKQQNKTTGSFSFSVQIEVQ